MLQVAYEALHVVRSSARRDDLARLLGMLGWNRRARAPTTDENEKHEDRPRNGAEPTRMHTDSVAVLAELHLARGTSQ